MGKGWDNSGIAFQPDTWKKCLDALKPGGYLLSFGGSRTYHRIACAIEDAGFEIRDCIMWLYGSGFPKSLNIGLAIDKKNGVESEVVGEGKSGVSSRAYQSEEQTTAGEYQIKKASNKWNGWGTALKPSYEPIIVARKPLEGSCTDNVIKYGVGGINIDECRVQFGNETDSRVGTDAVMNTEHGFWQEKGNNGNTAVYKEGGRFPANTILTYDESDFEEVCGGFPNSGKGNNKGAYNYAGREYDNSDTSMFNGDKPQAPSNYNDSGSAARYFKNCDFSLRDIDQWKQLYVSNAEKSLEILSETIESIVPISADMLLGMLKDLNVKYAENQLDLGEIHIVPDIVEMLTYDFRKEGLQAILDFIGNYKNCIQLQSLVQFVEKCDSIDTTQTTQNLLKLFGYVRAAITKYTQTIKNEEQKRYIYTPKASKRDRDEGLGTEITIDIILSDKNGKIWKGENIIRDEKSVNADIEAYLKSDTGEYGILNKEDLDLSIILYMKNIIEKYLNECKSTTKMGINSTTIYQILNWLIHLNTKENTLDVKQYDEKYISHVESAENGNLFEITIKEKSELVHDVNNAVLKMQLRIREKEKHSTHPTVKPCDLMQYLVRLVTPNGGTVLDPFNGSGSTGKAVMYENKDRNKNYKYIGIELTEEYLPIAKARIEYVINKGIEKEKSDPKQEEQTKQRKESALF